MKFAADGPWSDPEKAARKLLEIANDVEVDDQARAVVGPLTQELADARSHGALPHSSGGGEPPDDADRSSSPARDGDALANVGLSTRLCCLGLEWGSPRSARPAMMNKPLR